MDALLGSRGRVAAERPGRCMSGVVAREDSNERRSEMCFEGVGSWVFFGVVTFKF